MARNSETSSHLIVWRSSSSSDDWTLRECECQCRKIGNGDEDIKYCDKKTNYFIAHRLNTEQIHLNLACFFAPFMDYELV